jgi:hypothetical protein
MNPFARCPDILTLPARKPINVAPTTQPRDWTQFDTPAWQRFRAESAAREQQHAKLMQREYERFRDERKAREAEYAKREAWVKEMEAKLAYWHAHGEIAPPHYGRTTERKQA